MRLKAGTIWQIVFSAGVTAMAFAIVYVVWGFHYEILDDSYRIAFMQGMYYEKPINDFQIYYIGISQVLSYLYYNYTHVEWYSVFTLVTLFLSLSTILYSLIDAFKGLFNYKYLNYVFPLLLYSILSVYYLVSWHWTKTASICTISALMLCIQYARGSVAHKPSTYRLVLITILLLLGLCIRYQNVLVLLVIACMYVILVQRTLRPLIFPLLLTGIFIGGIELKNSLYPSADIELLNQIEPYVFSHLDAGSVNCNQPINNTEGDKAKIALFEDWFFTDFEAYTPSFLATYFTTDVLSKCTLENIVVKLKNQWADYGHYLFYNIGNLILLAFSCLVICLFLPSTKWIGILLFNIGFVLLMLAIAIVIKLEKRHLTPFISLMCLLNVYNLALSYKRTKTSDSNLWIGVLLSTLFFLLVPALQYANDFSRFKHSEEQFCRNFRSELETKFSSNIVAMDVWTCMAVANAAPFEIAIVNKKRNFLIYDSGYGMFYNNARQEIEAKTKTQGFKEYMQYLCQHKAEVVIVQADYRSNLLGNYMQSVYSVPIVFSQKQIGSIINESGNFCAHKNIRYYVLN